MVGVVLVNHSRKEFVELGHGLGSSVRVAVLMWLTGEPEEDPGPLRAVFRYLGRWVGDRITVSGSGTVGEDFRDVSVDVLLDVALFYLISGGGKVLEDVLRSLEVVVANARGEDFVRRVYVEYVEALKKTCSKVDDEVCVVKKECPGSGAGGKPCTSEVRVAPEPVVAALVARYGDLGSAYRALAVLGLASPANGPRQELERFLKAPVVMHPPEEHLLLPVPLKKELAPSRLEAYIKGDFERGLASVADLVVYLYSVVMKMPVSEAYVKIYTYYANTLFRGKLGNALPEAVPETLSPYEVELAERLRREILRAQMRAGARCSGGVVSVQLEG